MSASETRELDALMQDKLEAHCRQQLSSMLDGALAPDQARFLLRRLQHDHELAGCWERWQVYGDLLRGGVPALLPADFSRRVQAALADEGQAHAVAGAATGAGRVRWAGWAGGAALAASVAVAALFVNQRAAPNAEPPAGTETQLAATAPAPTQPRPAPAPAGPTPSPLEAAGTVAAAALAAADAPRRAAAQRERGTARRAVAAVQAAETSRAPARRPVETPPPATADAPAWLAVAPPSAAPESADDRATPPSEEQQVAARSVEDLFVGEAIAPARPWPRAILPGLSGSGVTVDYGEPAPAADGGFDPFQPQLPAEPTP